MITTPFRYGRLPVVLSLRWNNRCWYWNCCRQALRAVVEWQECRYMRSNLRVRRFAARQSPKCRSQHLKCCELKILSYFMHSTRCQIKTRYTTGVKQESQLSTHRPTINVGVHYTLCSEKNTHFCFLASLLEKVTNLNENFRQNS